MNVYRVEIPPQHGQPEPTKVWWREVRALTEQAARDAAVGRFHNAFGYEPDPATVGAHFTGVVRRA
jgi:hypothetical protein